jgi:hypothetical protein
VQQLDSTVEHRLNRRFSMIRFTPLGWLMWLIVGIALFAAGQF